MVCIKVYIYMRNSIDTQVKEISYTLCVVWRYMPFTIVSSFWLVVAVTRSYLPKVLSLKEPQLHEYR